MAVAEVSLDYAVATVNILTLGLVCIGSHFAELELRHALTNFYRTFEDGVKMSSVEGFSEDDMTPKSYFLSPPKGTRCLVERRK